MISPGSFPKKGIFPPKVKNNPSRIKIPPKIKSNLPISRKNGMVSPTNEL
jgi:hypothetical protein